VVHAERRWTEGKVSGPPLGTGLSGEGEAESRNPARVREGGKGWAERALVGPVDPQAASPRGEGEVGLGLSELGENEHYLILL
jgi:hypothetical protein